MPSVLCSSMLMRCCHALALYPTLTTQPLRRLSTTRNYTTPLTPVTIILALVRHLRRLFWESSFTLVTARGRFRLAMAPFRRTLADRQLQCCDWCSIAWLLSWKPDSNDSVGNSIRILSAPLASKLGWKAEGSSRTMSLRYTQQRALSYCSALNFAFRSAISYCIALH